MEKTQAQPGPATQVGNPLLGQIHEFIQGNEPTPLDPLGMVTRAMRGRVRRIAILVFST